MSLRDGDAGSRVRGPAPLTSRVAGVIAALTLAAMGALEFSGAFGVLEAYSPLSPYTLSLVAAGAVGVLALAWRGGEPGDWLLGVPVVAVIGYLLAETISYLNSELSPAATADAVTTTLKFVPYAVVICVLAVGVRRWGWVACAIVVPMSVICLLGMINEFLLGNSASFGGFETVTNYLGVGVETARHAGPLEDPNFWGRLLVMGLPLSLALTQRTWTAGRRSLAVGAALCTVLMLAGVYLSGSRGAFIGAGLAIVAYPLCLGARRGVLVAAAALGVALLAVPGVGSRLFSYGMGPGVQWAAEDGSVLSRLATQRVAIEMAADRPITGVGPGGYLEAFGQYAAQGQVVIDRVIAPHNLYLGLLAETGVIGLLAFLALLGAGIGLAGHTLWLTRGMTEEDRTRIRPYAAAVVAGILGWAATSIFLHLSYARAVIFVVCLAAALNVHARRLPQVRPRAIRRELRGRIAHGLGGALLLGAVGVIAALVVPYGSTATRTGYLEPATADSSYLLSLRTRSTVVPGYAVVIGVSAPTPVDAQGDPATGLITVTATGSSPDAASIALDQAIAAGTAVQERVGMTVFRLRWLGPTTTTPTAPTTLVIAGAGLVGAVVGAIVGLIVSRRRTRRKDRTASVQMGDPA